MDSRRPVDGAQDAVAIAVGVGKGVAFVVEDTGDEGNSVAAGVELGTAFLITTEELLAKEIAVF
ncbi:MAG TPA: hypothetical protein VJ123_01300 [Anaerolineales bacterium]|nr:hypothetical protein [Anaerolineales bacterium]